MIAVVRVRGLVGRESSVEGTLRSLRLYRKNYCAALEETPEVRGMISKARNFITWGEIDDETLNLLRQRSKSKFYRLSSPKKGFGRKGIKHHFSRGGALGNRKEKINDLIRRML